MSLPEITVCPSTLRPGFTTFSALAQADLFGSRSKKVSHVLPFGSPGSTIELTKEYNEKRKKISFSGVQEKYSLLLEKNRLVLTDNGGTHILKPVPVERFERVTDLPANEHVSMQMAKQVFKARIAEGGMLFFDDGTPAYLTRRFDYKPGGAGSGKYQLEDFAALMGKTPEREGDDFKYNASYLDVARIIRRYAAAAPVALVDFFRLLVINYLIANGDAHLKNFSLTETAHGDFVLAPAYDLLCTALHTDDSLLALHGGLYDGDHNEKTFFDTGMYTGASFLVFAEKAGISVPIAKGILNDVVQGVPAAIELVGRCFLSEVAKARYIQVLRSRVQYLLRV
ncbi:MAG TPA: HipA domain-containing protein [Puia sp.]|nr:HipA domain-containing protein [Puia sp.]